MAYNEESKCKKYTYYLKAICCAIFQTFGLIIFLYNVMEHSDKGFCEMNGDWDVRIIATM